MVRSAVQLPQTQVPDAALQEQEKIASLTLDLLRSLGFDEEEFWRVRGSRGSGGLVPFGSSAPLRVGAPHDEPHSIMALAAGGVWFSTREHHPAIQMLRPLNQATVSRVYLCVREF